MSQTHYSENLSSGQLVNLPDRMQAARFWLAIGASLLPVQPFSKKLVKGWGPHLRQIKSELAARPWFELGRHNIAVCCPGDLLALDFDDQALFIEWSDSIPVEYSQTYQETSPRGFHVFFRVPAGIPGGLKLAAGAEIKRVIMVSPSTLPGFVYRRVNPGAELVEVHEWETILSSLLLSDQKPEPIIAPAGEKRTRRAAGNDLIERLKDALPIYQLASGLTELKPSGGSGRWFVGRCPFPEHEDRRPSFWIDAERGLWGCHACGLVGDSLNLYARIHKLPLQTAIRELARELLQ